jgi:hypothetical protein
MAGAGIQSFAKFRGQLPWIATTGITSWQNALKWTADCQFRAQVAAVKSSLWQSALKFQSWAPPLPVAVFRYSLLSE